MGAPNLESTSKSDESSDLADSFEEAVVINVEEGEGPWLVSYADLMTLLMGFFALIASMSTINKENFETAKQSAAQAFGGEYEKPYEELGESLKKFIKENNLEDLVDIEVGVNGVQLTFSGTLFFESGEYRVKERGAYLMTQLSAAIQKEKNQYSALVEGHTDSVPISQGVIASNWELSGIRAARIAQILEDNGMDRMKMTIIGWGETKPAFPEHNELGVVIPENREKNRRVVLRIYDSKISDDPVSK